MKKVYLLLIVFFSVVSSCSNDDTPTTQNPDIQQESPINPTPSAEDNFNIEVSRAFENLTFNQPVFLTNAKDGSNDLFVVEKGGKIFTINNSSDTPTKNLFVDLTSDVKSNESEQGLLGLAFHPNYKENGTFFIHYSSKPNGDTRIASLTVSGGQVNLQSQKTILEVPQPRTNHNGGSIDFGPDGFLYIGLGDGGGSGDPEKTGQDNTDLLGTILRLDINQTSGNRPYAIPTDNPFVGSTNGEREEIFAYGLRNPYRFSFDRKTGDLWVGDVGQNAFEEIDIITNGGNYGWNITEGNSCFGSDTCDTSELIKPILSYSHDIGRSVTGGYVYRGTQFKSLEGIYFYADFVNQKLFQFNTTSDTKEVNEVTTLEGFGVSSFGEDENGELYLVDFFSGGIYSIIAVPKGSL